MEISDLPDDILLEIFKLLDYNSILQSFLVNKRWNLFLSTSATINNRIEYIFTSEKLKEIDDKTLNRTINNQRKIFHMKIDNDTWDKSENRRQEQFFVSLIRANQGWLRSLHINTSQKDFNLHQILMSDCEIENLTIGSRTCFEQKSPKIENLVKLENLKNLKVLGSSVENIFDFFHNSQIEHLTIDGWKFSTHKSLRKFLASQKSIKSFHIEGLPIDELFEQDLTSSDKKNQQHYQLKKFSVSSYSRELGGKSEKNLKKFLETHGRDVEVLLFDCFLTSKIFDFVISELQKLKEITVIGSFIPNLRDFDENLKSNMTVKKLKILGSLAHVADKNELNSIKFFISKFPSADSLYVDEINNFVFDVIHGKNKNLVTLSIGRFPDIPNDEEFKFERLKNVEIGFAFNLKLLDCLINFIQQNSNITNLKINRISITNVTADTLRRLFCGTSLKVISFGGDKEAMKKIHDLVKIIGWKNLEILKLFIIDPFKKPEKLTFLLPKKDTTELNLFS